MAKNHLKVQDFCMFQNYPQKYKKNPNKNPKSSQIVVKSQYTCKKYPFLAFKTLLLLCKASYDPRNIF